MRRFRVEDFSLLRSRLLWCYEGAVSAEDLSRYCREGHLTAWLVRRGHVTLRFGDRSLTARAGEWIFGGPAPRWQLFSRNARIVSVNFRLEWPSGDSLIDGAVIIAVGKFSGLERAAGALVRLVRRQFPGVRTHLWQCGTELAPFFELNRHFSAWLSEYLRAALAAGIVPTHSQGGMDPRVRAALRRLDAHAWDRPFQDGAMAGEAGLSIRHFDRLFVRQLGVTPRQYLEKRRMEAAVSFLGDRAAPVKTIAYDLGFCSPGHFTHWFRRRRGMSPRDFRLEGRSGPRVSPEIGKE